MSTPPLVPAGWLGRLEAVGLGATDQVEIGELVARRSPRSPVPGGESDRSPARRIWQRLRVVVVFIPDALNAGTGHQEVRHERVEETLDLTGPMVGAVGVPVMKCAASCVRVHLRRPGSWAPLTTATATRHCERVSSTQAPSGSPGKLRTNEYTPNCSATSARPVRGRSPACSRAQTRSARRSDSRCDRGTASASRAYYRPGSAVLHQPRSKRSL